METPRADAPVIDVRGLRKEYRNGVVAVDDLDITIEGAGVHGFLGPNGSGKTTTIRCLLGLIRPSAGDVRIHGVDTTTSLHSVIDRVGALVETPKFFPNFSGRKNLKLLAGVIGIPDRRVEECLDIVGLGERGKDRFGTYSLGMKQRLAVAATLLKDPDLIVLDEPANGLDPAGIVEIRQLIRSLGEQGKTIFVSSHQLGEVQQTCDEVMIISKGRLVRKGPVAEIASLGAGQDQIVSIPNVPEAMAVLQQAGYKVRPGNEPNTLLVQIDPTQAGGITKTLADGGHYLQGLRTSEASLESVFLELTRGEGSL
jgi:ABC-2 type transport system ATP-binding protein